MARETGCRRLPLRRFFEDAVLEQEKDGKLPQTRLQGWKTGGGRFPPQGISAPVPRQNKFLLKEKKAIQAKSLDGLGLSKKRKKANIKVFDLLACRLGRLLGNVPPGRNSLFSKSLQGVGQCPTVLRDTQRQKSQQTGAEGPASAAGCPPMRLFRQAEAIQAKSLDGLLICWPWPLFKWLPRRGRALKKWSLSGEAPSPWNKT